MKTRNLINALLLLHIVKALITLPLTPAAWVVKSKYALLEEIELLSTYFAIALQEELDVFGQTRLSSRWWSRQKERKLPTILSKMEIEYGKSVSVMFSNSVSRFATGVYGVFSAMRKQQKLHPFDAVNTVRKLIQDIKKVKDGTTGIIWNLAEFLRPGPKPHSPPKVHLGIGMNFPCVKYIKAIPAEFKLIFAFALGTFRVLSDIDSAKIDSGMLGLSVGPVLAYIMHYALSCL